MGENFGFIYITTNLINGKKYIGQKIYKGPWKSYLGSGRILKQAIEKYGKENFSREIVYNALTKDDLDFHEKEFINKYDAYNNSNFYNIHEGGTGGNTLAGYSEEERKQFGDKLKNTWTDERKQEQSDRISGDNNPALNLDKNPMSGYEWSDNQKQKMSESLKKAWEKQPELRKVFSEQMKERMKGENNPMYGRKPWSYGKLRPDHSEKMKGRYIGDKAPWAKKVKLIKNGEVLKVFTTVKEACYGDWRKEFPKPNGIKHIGRCIKEKLDFHGHYLIMEE